MNQSKRRRWDGYIVVIVIVLFSMMICSLSFIESSLSGSPGVENLIAEIERLESFAPVFGNIASFLRDAVPLIRDVASLPIIERIRTASDEAVLFMIPALPLGVAVIFVFTAWRRSLRATEPGLPASAQSCCVCHTPQKAKRLKQCYHCGGWFCDFPLGGWRSPREQLDSVVGPLAVIFGCALTAFTVLGGVIMLAALAIPYFIFRSLLPGSNRLPTYWRQCGGTVYDQISGQKLGDRCNACGGPVAAPPLSSSQVSGSSQPDYSNYPNYIEEPSYYSPSNDNDDPGHPMDGWLVKW